MHPDLLSSDLQRSLADAVSFEVWQGPAFEVFPPRDSLRLAACDDLRITHRAVAGLQVAPIPVDRVVPANGPLELQFKDADGDWLDRVEVFPGWIRAGWPVDGRLMDSTLSRVLLDELGVSMPADAAMLRAIDRITPRFATGRRTAPAGEDQVDHAVSDAGTLCGIVEADVVVYRHLFSGDQDDCPVCSLRMWTTASGGGWTSMPIRLGQEEADAMTTAWAQHWPNSPIIADELKRTELERWVRFYSLPDGKRYAETDSEAEEVLHRCETVLEELSNLTDETGPLAVVTCSWSGGSIPHPRSTPLDQALPNSRYWHSILEDKDDEDDYWTHLYVDLLELGSPGLTTLLSMVAGHAAPSVIIAPPDLEWIYHPYDGGADVIAPTTQERNALRSRHQQWLSPRLDGL